MEDRLHWVILIEDYISAKIVVKCSGADDLWIIIKAFRQNPERKTLGTSNVPRPGNRSSHFGQVI